MLSLLKGIPSTGVPGEPSAGSTRVSKGGPERYPQPIISGIAPDVYGHLLSCGTKRGVPSGGVPGEGI